MSQIVRYTHLICSFYDLRLLHCFADTKQRVERELADAAKEMEGSETKAGGGGGDSDTDSENDEKHGKGLGTLNELEASIYSLNTSVSSLDASVVLAEVSTCTLTQSTSSPHHTPYPHPHLTTLTISTSSLHPHPYPHPHLTTHHIHILTSPHSPYLHPHYTLTLIHILTSPLSSPYLQMLLSLSNPNRLMITFYRLLKKLSPTHLLLSDIYKYVRCDVIVKNLSSKISVCITFVNSGTLPVFKIHFQFVF